jgi:hypothetical protein
VEKMRAHGVSVRHADEILVGDPRVLRNQAAHGAALMIVGPDASGRFVTIPIDPTTEHGVWRPRTACPSRPSEVARHRRQRS